MHLQSNVAARFWSKVDTNGPVPPHRPELGPCWEWRGATMDKGYGHLRTGGRGTPHVYSHRLAWEIANGPVPEGLWVLHACDNRPCCRPSHLFLGTAQDNTADMMAKGRGRSGPGGPGGVPPCLRGSANPLAKLTDSAVREMRSLHAEGVSQRRLAVRFGVSKSTVNDVLQRHKWAHVD
jgi:hypothetical protein